MVFHTFFYIFYDSKLENYLDLIYMKAVINERLICDLIFSVFNFVGCESKTVWTHTLTVVFPFGGE